MASRSSSSGTPGRSSSRVESFRVGSPVGGRSPVRLRDLVPEDSQKEAYQEGETEYSQAESFLWGVGRAKNDRRARKWAEAAASLGSHPAQAWCLQEGWNGGPLNATEAQAQFTKLSTAGHAGAQCHLGYQLTRKGVRTARIRNRVPRT